MTIEAGDKPVVSWIASAYTDHCKIGPTNSTSSKPNLFGAMWDAASTYNKQQTNNYLKILLYSSIVSSLTLLGFTFLLQQDTPSSTSSLYQGSQDKTALPG